MSTLRILAIAASLGLSTPALACSPVESDPPTRQQIEDGYEQAFLRSDTVARVIVVTSPTARHGGRVRVLSVYKGALREGAIVRFLPRSGDSCDLYEVLAPGDQGIIAVNIEAPDFGMFLSADALDTLRRRGRLNPRDSEQ